jgi:hypothetical protein
MTAKEYYEKYHEQLLNPATVNFSVVELLTDLVVEAKDIQEKQTDLSDAVTIRVIKEQNRKWNAISGLLGELSIGSTIILPRDKFKEFMCQNIPSVKEYFMREREAKRK